jgi:hypothetical protein
MNDVIPTHCHMSRQHMCSGADAGRESPWGATREPGGTSLQSRYPKAVPGSDG